jgi:ring-1,2-phenylacetyl-CoA epoxidase subunit PaaA
MTTVSSDAPAALQEHFDATMAHDKRFERRDWMPEG